jgi:hypothetical protein
MKIKTLRDMEEIVRKSPDLFWDGWDVCINVKGDGFYAMDGVFNGKEWVVKKTFRYDYGYWDIPDGYIKDV